MDISEMNLEELANELNDVLDRLQRYNKNSTAFAQQMKKAYKIKKSLINRYYGK